jgi:hypothetical protein
MDREGRILLDVPPGWEGDFDRSILEKFEHPVDVCHGPAPGAICPLLRGEGCTLVDTAHGIVFALDLDRPQHRAILEAYRRTGTADRPIRVVVSTKQMERYGDLLGDFEVWDHDPSVADLDGFAAEVEAVDRYPAA